MSEIVDTKEGSFRRVTDGKTKWWLWECPSCKGLQPVDLDNSITISCAKKCGHVGRDLGSALVARMQAHLIMGESPTHEEGQPHKYRSGGIDGP